VEEIVRVEGLTAGYRSTRVLDSLSLTVGPGLTALLGPNGAGKTTLLHVLAGVHRGYRGRVSILGRDVARRDARRATASGTGFLPQHLGYLPSYSARDFVRYAAWLKKVPAEQTDGLVESALADVDMAGNAGKLMRQLSGGMLRRVGIAAALVHRPELLILDEPSVGLDPQQRVEMRHLMTRLRESTAILMSTHLIDDIRGTCDTVLIMDGGQLRFAGTPEELATRSAGAEAPVEAGYLDVLARAASPLP
jgi:ABC-2 type transport system ATP-binding protein